MPLDRQTLHVTSQLSSGIWQVLHSSPFSKSVSSHSQQQRSQECCQGQSVAVHNKREVVFFVKDVLKILNTVEIFDTNHSFYICNKHIK